MDRVTKAWRFFAAVRRGCGWHGVPLAVGLRHAAALYAEGFSPREIVSYALYVPAVRQRYPLLISKERSLARLLAINPARHHDQTEDKDTFYRLCAERGLPFPQHYGSVHGGVAYLPDGRPAETRAAWREHLRTALPADFVVKDLGGAYGSGFTAWRREAGDRFTNLGTGAHHSLDDMIEAWHRWSGFGGVVIQQRVYDAEPLRRLCGVRTLQTFRVVTELRDGRPSVLFHFQKVVVGDSLTDNFAGGTTGNLLAFFDRDSGLLDVALQLSPGGSGLVEVTTHPLTGASIRGFALPHFQAALELAQRAQMAFPDLPCLGWDIALTDDGPLLIEANARWDPPNYRPEVLSAADWRRLFGPPPAEAEDATRQAAA
ncbi:sugar-transfer associated ATP-grasp domain-containing protein [Caenispirillum bisanense]|uniref:sugar-transfer associated ATP-grasp domain-containing protein n=1 Tax=Caenispirillum bisanense TaxID=414052 RepID=UPI0031E1A66E